MTSTPPDGTPPPRTAGEALAEFHRGLAQVGNAWRTALDQLRRTVSVVLPLPDQASTDRHAWTGDGWSVELVGQQLVTAWDEDSDPEGFAAALLAAARIRRTSTDPEE